MNKDHPFTEIIKLSDLDQMFDMLIYAIYSYGSLGRSIPVDEAREVFERIKELVRKGK